MKVSGNAPCRCGSGRKFKRCCAEGVEDTQRLTPGLVAGTITKSALRPDEEDIQRRAHKIMMMVHNGCSDGLPHWVRAYLGSNFDCLPHFVDGFVGAWNEIDQPNDSSYDLVETYAYLLQVQLTSLSAGVNNKIDRATQALAHFEQRLIDAIERGQASASAIMEVGKIMFEARLPTSPRLAQASELRLARDVARPESKADPLAICAEIADQCGGNPFLMNEAILAGSHISPGGIRVPVTPALLTAPERAIREAAALGVLDSDPKSRRATAAALAHEYRGITRATLRRLTTIRRWLPEAERALIDQAVKNARLEGIKCAPWEAGEKVVEIRASVPDGVGAQMAMVISKAAGGYRLSGLLFKQGKGVADAWTNDPEPWREVKRMVKRATSGVPLLQISSAFLERLIGHYLHEGLTLNLVAPVRLLEIAEILLAPQWQPAPMGWREMLEDLITQVPESMRTPASVRAIIESSAVWATNGHWAVCWLEDESSVAEIIDCVGQGHLKALRGAILDRVTEKRRSIWAERFTLTALWMQQAEASARLPWRNLVIVARALLDGVPLREIALMSWIARESAICMSEEYAEA